MIKKILLMVAMLIAVSGAAQNGSTIRDRFAARRNAMRGVAAPQAAAAAPVEQPKPVIGTNGVPSLAFQDAPLDLVLTAYAEQKEKTVLQAPDLPKVQITLKSLEGQTLSKEEYLEAIEIVLTMNGVVLEERGEKFLRALPRKTVRTEGIPLIMQQGKMLPEKGHVVSQMIEFQNIGVEEGQKALEGFKHPNGLFQIFERTNSLLVTDTQENINRMLEIVRAIDVKTAVNEEVFVYQVVHGVATDIKTALETIVTESQKDDKTPTSGAKMSGAPGFGSAQRPTSIFNRLNRNQPEPPKPNETLRAGISDADKGMIRGKVVIFADERSNKLIIITSKAKYNFFEKVIKTLDVPTEPEFKVEVIRLRYADAEEVYDMLNDLVGGMSNSSSKKNQNQNAAKGKSGNMTTGRTTTGSTGAGGTAGGNRVPSSVGDLNKDNCKILADKRINAIVIMTRTELMPIVKSVVEDMDVRLSQVLIETVIVEVQLGDDLTTGMDWVRLGAKNDKGMREGFWSGDKNGDADGGKKGNMLGGGGGSGSDVMKNMLAVGTNTLEIKNFSPIGAGINYFLKSDKLNLGAVIQAAKSDSRSKYLASPIIMTVDNKEATIEATEMSYLLKGYTYSGSTYNGTTVPDYEQKELGITIKTTPKINPDGTVMLTVETEYSQVGANQQIEASVGGNTQKVTVPTTITRKMSADISLENQQTVVLGGLTKTSVSDAETGIPILKDIPYIGKYLFGTTIHSEGRKELLIFMTPYVLDEGNALQAEAARRKRALSDARPWEDNGWSKSALADPISEKEALRRFTDEWEKQDEERKTKMAIEKAKIDRMKKLEGLTEEQRKFWLEIYKKDLEDEQREALEKKMLDPRSQMELKKIADKEREKRLKRADQKIRDNAELVRENSKQTKAELLELGVTPSKVPSKAVKPEVAAAKPADKAVKPEVAAAKIVDKVEKISIEDLIVPTETKKTTKEK